MPLSETVLAATIGAIATIGTALFQLISSLRSRTKVETRTRGVSFRSLIAIAALMIACGFGGFGYSEWRIERDSTQTLRQELMEQLQALQASTAKLELVRAGQANPRDAATEGSTANTEAMVELPPCQAQHADGATESTACTEANAQHLALCALIPANAAVDSVDLYARPVDSSQPWDSSRVAVNQEANATRFTQTPVERAQGSDGKSVCAALTHWNSAHANSVRMVVKYLACTGAAKSSGACSAVPEVKHVVETHLPPPAVAPQMAASAAEAAT